MEKTITGKSVHRKWIVPVLAVFLLMAVLIIWQCKKQETEYSIIQAIIEELPHYQSEIESWGYEVSVLPKMFANWNSNPGVDEQAYPKEYPNMLTFGNGFSTGSYTPDFVEDWLKNWKKAGVILKRDDVLWMSKEIREDLVERWDDDGHIKETC